MRLIQETHCTEPWQILLACVVLNRTQATQVAPVLSEMTTRWPSRETMAAAEIRDVEAIVAPLGLRKRAADVVKMAHRLKEVPDSNRREFVSSLPGCGEYAADAWCMLVDGARDFWPRDAKLGPRMVELRLDIRVLRDFNNRFYLHLVSDDCRSCLIGPTDSQGRDLVAMKREDRDRLTPVEYDSRRLAKRWLDGEKYIPLTERAKEILMNVICINKRGEEGAKFLGRFDDLTGALDACPTGCEVINVPEDLDGFSLVALTEIYNMIVPQGKRVKGFGDKKTASARIEKAVGKIDGHGAPPTVKKQREPREKGQKTAREILREFLVVGKEFTVDEVATLLDTTKSNAATTLQLLKTRPGAHHHALITEKMQEGNHRVTQAPTEIEVVNGAA